MTKNEKGHKLVVCRQCYSNYKKRFDKYRSRQAIYLILGTLFLIFEAVISLSSVSVALGILVLVLFYLFSLFNYTPRLNVAASTKSAQMNKHNQ